MSGAGGTKTTFECCFWTTGEDHLMSRNGRDGEFSERVTEALKAQEASEWTLDKKIYNYGVVAQMGERLNGIQKVRGSIPLSSTNIKNRLSKPVFFISI